MMRPQTLNYFFKPVSSLSGVGPKTKANLNNLFRNSEREEPLFKDIITHIPHSLIKRQREPNLLLIPNGTEIITTVDVDKIEQKRIGGKLIYNILCSNKTGFLTIVYFNAIKDFIEKNFKIDSSITISGKVERFNNRVQIVHPYYLAKTADSAKIPEFEPVYPLTLGINNKLLNKLCNNILGSMPALEEWCEVNFLKANNFDSFSDSIRKIHSPQNPEDLDIYTSHRKRLAYDEILANQLALSITRRSIVKQKGIIIDTKNIFIKETLKNLPFKLTEGQRAILKEILADFRSGNRMFRLLQGDVGSGKTIVAILAIMDAVEAGHQTAFILPTEILARQQFESVSKILAGEFFIKNNIKACLLTGSLKAAQKNKIQQEISEGKYQIIVGTHALLQEKVNYKNLSFLVIDEQHRFGVKQRMELAQKGENTHALLMSATPIPRTLAMTIYGDLEVSSLTEKPSGRQNIATRALALSRTDEVIEGITRAIKEDNRVYWVCPLIIANESENPENVNASVEARYRSLKKIFGEKVSIVHGQMKPKDKEDAINKFRDGKAKILVATTVIEVGVDVPEATIMVIEQSEKFGLAQLHQLRGRVGRSDRRSSCILLFSDNTTDTGKQRLSILKETNDGFRIAEEDLAIRGSGDLIGVKQSGFPDFIFAILPEHKDLLFTARDDVKMILNSDPELKSERGIRLRNLLYFYEYDKQIKLLNV